MLSVDHQTFLTILSLYDRTEKSFDEDINAIKNWLKTQTHLPEIMDDARIKNFLLMNKCSVEKAKEKIDNYYTLRATIPEFCLSLDCEEIKMSRKIGYWVPLPKLTQNMCRVHMIKISNPELLEHLDPVPYFARGFYVQEIRLREDCMFKEIAVVDMEGITWGHLLKVTPMMLIKLIMIYEKIYSNRLGGVYVINSFPAVEKILNFVKRVLKPKLFERIHVSTDTKILLEAFPKAMIPKDYGGEEISLQEINDLWDKKLNEYKDWFDKIYSMRVNEDLRPPKLVDDDNFGPYGNFKKLSVD